MRADGVLWKKNTFPRSLCVLGVLAGLLVAGACRKLPERPKSVAAAVAQRSASCRECHEEIFQAWSDTDHALANRPVDHAKDVEALASMPSKEEIFAKLLYVINAPAQKLVTVINAVGRDIAVVINQGVEKGKFGA